MRTIISILLLLTACNANKVPKKVNCLDSKIEKLKANNCKESDIKEYVFQGKTVFVLYPGKCGADFQDEVVDSDCATLGYLGGITGNRKINGADFGSANFVKVVWQK